LSTPHQHLETYEGWEYATADTQYHVHGIHPYPARMIPQIANRLIRERSNENATVLDPFCGSGSVLVEALLLRRNCIGVDINPLAALIAKVKTAAISPQLLEPLAFSILDETKRRIKLSRRGEVKPDVFFFKNIFHWFKRTVVSDLSIVKQVIEENKTSDENINNFFNVCFSATLRKASNIAFNDNPYFIRAKPVENLERYNPDVQQIFQDVVKNSLSRTVEFYSICPKGLSCKILEADSRNLPVESDSVDLVVTSPPYGEESHTMSYSRFSKLSLLWMGMSRSEINRYTMKTLGGKIIRNRSLSPTLDSIYRRIAEKDSERANEVFSFFNDYGKCLQDMFRVMRKNAYACIVIGDRSASGIPVSNEIITRELGEIAGFEHETTYQREIPKKVLPRRDYKVELINKENIIILKKP